MRNLQKLNKLKKEREIRGAKKEDVRGAAENSKKRAERDPEGRLWGKSRIS